MSIAAKKKEILEGGLVGNTNVTYRDLIQKKYDDVKIDHDARNKLKEEFDVLQKQF
jgi:hypothetical protein